MFRGCSNLKAVNIKGDITSIGDGCFAETALTNFTIPSTVKYLGEYAFDQTDIKSIKLPAELVLEVSINFKWVHNLCKKREVC